MNNKYYAQVSLMLQVLPFVIQEKCFALKGGTAINFFVRNLPRYSVDIDLTFIPLLEREVSLNKIVAATENIARNVEFKLPTVKVIRQYTKHSKRLVKLLIQSQEAQIKIEPNELIRGAIFPIEMKTIVPAAEDEFQTHLRMQVLSLAELYGGKICAALDRQHPRDLFDIKLLLENEGITDEIRKAFVVYLASHNRPLHELLAPNLLDISLEYETNFVGMSKTAVNHNNLLLVRESLIKTINEELTDNERTFLLSLKQGEPDWNLLKIQNLDKFPAIQWKLLNIRKMDRGKHQKMIEKLKDVLKL